MKNEHEAACPKCGKVFKARSPNGARGAVQLHLAKSHGKQETRAGHAHRWRVLHGDPSHHKGPPSTEERLVRRGYSVVCECTANPEEWEVER